jgi:hypothetical protein
MNEFIKLGRKVPVVWDIDNTLLVPVRGGFAPRTKYNGRANLPLIKPRNGTLPERGQVVIIQPCKDVSNATPRIVYERKIIRVYPVEPTAERSLPRLVLISAPYRSTKLGGSTDINVRASAVVFESTAYSATGRHGEAFIFALAQPYEQIEVTTYRVSNFARTLSEKVEHY